LQTSGGYGAAFIHNPIRQRGSYANSGFDTRHIVNVNAIWEVPLGRGRRFFSGVNRGVDAVVGGWQLSGIYRFNSGLPLGTPYDDARWATNWNVQSNTIRVRPLQTCPDRGGAVAPKLFGCDPTGIYRSFRNARPGESGDRNVLRFPSYWVMDMALAKAFTMPWSENHQLQFRVDAVNIFNVQKMGSIDGSRTGYGIALDPGGAPFGCSGAACVQQPVSPPPNWSNFTSIQGAPRQVQIGIRYSF
jgi:hypothetical protein